MFLTHFKAEVEFPAIEGLVKYLPAPKVFTFSKRRIFLTDHQSENFKFYTGMFETRLLMDKTKYVLTRDFDKNDRKRYFVQFDKSTALPIRLNLYNYILMQYVHANFNVSKWLKKFAEKVFDRVIIFLSGVVLSYLTFFNKPNTQKALPNSPLKVSVVKTT